MKDLFPDTFASLMNSKFETKPKTSPKLSALATLLASWLHPSTLQDDCIALEQYWKGERHEKPVAYSKLGVPRKDSDFHVFSEALACVRYGWEGKADQHTERVKRRMKNTPILIKFPLAARVGVPQVRDGKE